MMGSNSTAAVILSGEADLNISITVAAAGDGGGNAGKPPFDPDVLRMHAILYLLHSYFEPSVIGLGLIFNSFALLLLLGTRLSALSSSRYLAASTLVDFLFLGALLIAWLAERGTPVYRLGAFCHVTTFLRRSMAFLSTWYTVAFSINRLVALCLPGWERQLCSPSKTAILLVALALVALVVFLNMSLTVGVTRIGTQYVCSDQHMFVDALRILNQIDSFVNILLPYILIALIWLICLVRCYLDRASEATAASAAAAGRRRIVARGGTAIILPQACLSNGQNAAFLLHGFVLMLLTSPLQVEQCRQTLSELAGLSITNSSRLLKELFKYPYYTRFCLNFFVCLSVHHGCRAVALDVAHRSLKTARQVLCKRSSNKENKIRHSVSAISLEEMQEEEQSRVALCSNSVGHNDYTRV